MFNALFLLAFVCVENYMSYPFPFVAQLVKRQVREVSDAGSKPSWDSQIPAVVGCLSRIPPKYLRE